MGKIVLHAGRGKTGSTSIQEWLRRDGARLVDQAGATVLAASADDLGQVSVDRHSTGTTNSATVMRYCWQHPRDRSRVLDEFFEQLGRATRNYGTVILSAEIFGRAIALGDADLLRRANAVASTHEVVIAYYIRPQDGELESGWRHWRSERERRPTDFIERLGRELHHLRTLEFVRDVAPEVDLQIRPFRRDLLLRGDVIADFAGAFLGIDPGIDTGRYWENRGVPIDVACALSSLPAPLMWPPDRDPAVLELVKDLLADSEPEDSDDAIRSRLVLQQVCHERFEEENRKLIHLLGWQTESWVAPVDADIGDAAFKTLDELWQPSASEAELVLLHRALARLLEQHQRSTGVSGAGRPVLRTAGRALHRFRRFSSSVRRSTRCA